jgi:hypothetical protein
MRANLLGTLGAGLLVWACAKANDSDLISRGKPVPSGGASGSSGAGGRAGSSAAAGTSSGSGGSAGKGGGGKNAGGTSAGTQSQAGNPAQGGAQSQAGTANEGGASQNEGGAGAGGEDGIDPGVLERADVVLRYQAMQTGADANQVQMRLYLENKTSDPLELAYVTIRYWMSSEATIRTLVCDYAAPLTSPGTNVQLRYVADEDDDDDVVSSHIEATFATGTVRGPTTDLNATEIQIRADADNPDRFDQENDYSFDAEKVGTSPPAPHDKITVYLANKLIWGCEPSGQCPSSGEGGAGGEAGQAGGAGQAGEAGSGGGGTAGSGGSSQGGEGGQGATGAEAGQGTDGGQPGGGQGGA